MSLMRMSSAFETCDLMTNLPKMALGHEKHTVRSMAMIT